MTLFEYQDYKKIVNDWVSQQPSKGRGQLTKMAEHLRVSSVIMSQVFRGDRDLSLEQAAGLCKFLGLNENERNFFLAMVSHARAGSGELKEIYEKQLATLRGRAQSLKNRIKHEHRFSEEEKGQFYSEWFYSAVRLRETTMLPQWPNI